MNIYGIIDGNVRADIQNNQDFSLNYTFEDDSPNIDIIEDFTARFRCLDTDPQKDAFSYILKSLQDNAGQNLDFTIKDQDSGAVFGDNILELYSEGAAYNLNSTDKYIDIPVKAGNKNFFDQAAALNLKEFYDSDNFVTGLYIRDNRPDYLEVVIISITLYLLTKELIEQTARSIEAVSDAIPAGPFDVSVFIKAAAKALVEVTILAFLVVAVFALLSDLSDALFGKPRRFYAVDVFDVFEKGCNYLGYDFSSTRLQQLKGLTFCASENFYEAGGELKTKLRGNPKNNPLPDETLLQWFERFYNLVNAKPRVLTNGVVQFEHPTFYETTPIDYTLSNLHLNGTETFNLSTLPKGHSIVFDENVKDGNLYTNKYTVTYLLKSATAEEKKNAVKTVTKVNVGGVSARRKNSQTIVEKSFNALYDIVTGVSRKSSLKIGERKGCVCVNLDAFTSNVLYIRKGDRVDKNSESTLNAENIYKTFWAIDAAPANQKVKINGRGNEPICDPVIVSQLRNNNYIKDYKGRNIQITESRQDKNSGLFTFAYTKRLQQGDLGYVSPDKWEVKEVIEENPIAKTSKWKTFVQTLTTF